MPGERSSLSNATDETKRDQQPRRDVIGGCRTSLCDEGAGAPYDGTQAAAILLEVQLDGLDDMPPAVTRLPGACFGHQPVGADPIAKAPLQRASAQSQ